MAKNVNTQQDANSNTTLVKVKYMHGILIQINLFNSNTTLVKVKSIRSFLCLCFHPYSNTTLVKVKLIGTERVEF